MSIKNDQSRTYSAYWVFYVPRSHLGVCADVLGDRPRKLHLQDKGQDTHTNAADNGHSNAGNCHRTGHFPVWLICVNKWILELVIAFDETLGSRLSLEVLHSTCNWETDVDEALHPYLDLVLEETRVNGQENLEKEADGRYGECYWDDIRGADLIDHRIDPVEVFSQDGTANTLDLQPRIGTKIFAYPCKVKMAIAYIITTPIKLHSRRVSGFFILTKLLQMSSSWKQENTAKLARTEINKDITFIHLPHSFDLSTEIKSLLVACRSVCSFPQLKDLFPLTTIILFYWLIQRPCNVSLVFFGICWHGRWVAHQSEHQCDFKLDGERINWTRLC